MTRSSLYKTYYFTSPDSAGFFDPDTGASRNRPPFSLIAFPIATKKRRHYMVITYKSLPIVVSASTVDISTYDFFSFIYFIIPSGPKTISRAAFGSDTHAKPRNI